MTEQQDTILKFIFQADELGLNGKERKEWVLSSLSFEWDMCKDEISEMHDVIKSLKKKPKISKFNKESYIEKEVQKIFKKAILLNANFCASK